MEFTNSFIEMAVIMGEQSRAAMLWYMLDGRAYTATELAVLADISPQSVSNHLNKMMDAGLLKVEQQGRHRYYSFANEDVAYAIEGLANLIPSYSIKKAHRVKGAKTEILFARTCYDHLAGKLAVSINSALLKKKFLTLQDDQFILSKTGIKWFNDLGINTEELKKKKRAFAKPCMDWTERRHHLAGSLGAGFLDFLIQKDWIRRVQNSRQVIATPKGLLNLEKLLGLKISETV